MHPLHVTDMPPTRKLRAKRKSSFPIAIRALCIQLVNTIFLIWLECIIGMHILSETSKAASQVTRNQAFLLHIPQPLFTLKQDDFSRPSFMWPDSNLHASSGYCGQYTPNLIVLWYSGGKLNLTWQGQADVIYIHLKGDWESHAFKTNGLHQHFSCLHYAKLFQLTVWKVWSVTICPLLGCWHSQKHHYWKRTTVRVMYLGPDDGGLGTPLASQDREMGVPSLAVYCRGPALISGRAAKVDQNSSCSRGLNNQRFTIRTSRQRFFTRNPAYRF